MGCGTCMLKCLLILFNVIFGLIGLVFLAAGAFVMASANNTIRPILDNALKSIPGLPAGFNLQDAAKVSTAGLTLDLIQVLQPVAICLIVMGTFLLITSIFGSFGSCCSNRCMLYTYAAIVLVLVLIQMLLIILFFTGSLDSTIQAKMKGMITDSFVGIDDVGFESLAWNVMMMHFKCCGVDGHLDFEKAKKWKRDRKVSKQGHTVQIKLAIPFACCKFTNPFPNMRPVDETCVTVPTEINSNYKQGCWKVLWKELESVMTIAKGASAGLLVFQILCAVAAIVIGHQIQKQKGETV